MSLLILLCAIAAWAVLRHQTRRHGEELAAACRRHGIQPDCAQEPVPVLESVLTILAGAALVSLASAVFLGAAAEGDPNQWGPLWRLLAVGMGAGLALLILGIRSLARLRRSSSGAPDATAKAS